MTIGAAAIGKRQKDTPSHDKNININNRILGIILQRNTVTRQKDTPSHDKNDGEKHTVTRQKTHHRKTKKHTDTRAKDHVTMARGKSSHDVFHEEEEPLISQQPWTALTGTWPYNIHYIVYIIYYTK